MPHPILIDDDTPIGAFEIKPAPPPLSPDAPSFVDTFKAGIRYDNDLLNAGFAADNRLRTLGEIGNQAAEKFNPLSAEFLELAPPAWWPELSTAVTKGEFFRKLNLREEEESAKSLQREGSNWANLASGIVNSFTSPFSLFPSAKGIKSLFFLPGYKSWAKANMPGLISGIAASEINLLYAQESRTAQEAATNVLVGSLMVGMLGATGQLFRSAKYSIYKDMISSAVEGKTVKFNHAADGELKGFSIIDDSAGAQSTRHIDLAGESLYGWGDNGEISLAKPFLWATGKFLRNPVVLGTTSKSATLRKFTNDALEHNFEIAKSVVKGEFSQQALQTKIWTRQAAAFENEMKIANSYFEYLGIDPNQGVAIKSLKSLVAGSSDKLKYNDYLTEMNLAITRGGRSEMPIVAREAKRIIDTLIKPASDELSALNMLPPNHTPFGAVQYLMRLYNKSEISRTRPQKEAFLVGQFAETNQKIMEATRPLENLNSKAAILKEDLASVSNKDQLKVLQGELKDIQKQLKRAQRLQNADIREGKYSPDMLVGDRGMPPDQIASLKALRDPITVYKKTLRALEKQLKQNPYTEKRLKIQAEIKAQKKLLKEYRQRVSEQLDAGSIDASFAFRTQKGEWRLKKPNLGTLKFRKILDESELQTAAENTIDTILGLSEEQLNASLIDSFKSGSGGPNPLMPRSLFVLDEKLIQNGFINTDVRKNINAFNLRVSRLIEMRKYVNEQGYRGEGSQLEFLSHGISEDFKSARRALEKEYASKLEKVSGKKRQSLESELKRKRLDLDTEQKEAVEIASSIYKRIMGQYDRQDGKLIRATNVLKNWAYSTQLGALFLLCMQDAVAPMYRQGFIPYVKYGIAPFIKNAAKLSRNNARLKESAQDIAVGIESDQAFYSMKFDMGIEDTVPRNFVEQLAKGAADSMGILNLASPFSDKFAHIAATASQSRLVRDITAFQKGTLHKTYLRQLQNLGLDPSVKLGNHPTPLGDRILAQVKEYGEELSGAYLPNWKLWDDIEAKRIFAGAIRQEVRSTNFTGSNIASYPIGADPNGLSGALMMYMGWGFNATANYLLPILQRNGMDVNKAMGMVAMMSVSSLVAPLRAIADGKEPDLEPGTLFKQALLNSGVLGTYGDLFNKINAIGNIFPELQVDRYKHTAGLVSFVPESMIRDIFKVSGMVANGEWNKRDIKSLQRMIPLTQLIYLRGLSNEFIDSLDLPETRAKAEAAANWR